MSGARRRTLSAVAVVVLLVAGGEFAVAQDTSRQQASALASQLMSPFCPGRLLVDCTSSQAYELRETIAARLASGEEVDAVKAALAEQYGHHILGAPPAEGVGLLAWLLPALIGLTMLAGVVVKVVHATRTAAARPLAAAPAGAARLLAQLDDELRELD